MTIPLPPPDTRAAGQAGHITDHNAISDTLAALVAQVGSGSVSQVSAADGSIVVAGTAQAPTIATGTLDAVAAAHPPAASWSNNSKKITSLANGSAATDAAAIGQVTLLSAYGQQQLATQRAAALQPWYAALANRHYTRANVVCIGDSITEGQGATQIDRRWVARLRDMLRTRFPTTGITGGGRGFLGTATTGESSFTWPASLTGSPTSGSTFGPKAFFSQLSSTGQVISYSLTGDSADIMWTQVPFGGTFSWKVDGGAATNISTNGGSTLDGKVTRVSLGSAGAHTLALTWVSGNSNVDGVIEYNGDSAGGIGVHDAGHYGWTSGNWAGSQQLGTATGVAAAIAALSPALVVITLGVNDQFSNVVPATFQANLQAMITDLRAALTPPYPSVVLQMLPPRTGQSGYTYPWSQYVSAAWNVAAADTAGPGGTSIVTVLDLTLGPRMRDADSDVYGLWHTSDIVHPSDKGHSLMGDVGTEFLRPQ